jgi:hypothetical protein
LFAPVTTAYLGRETQRGLEKTKRLKNILNMLKEVESRVRDTRMSRTRD